MNNLYIKETCGKGRGVFSNKNYKKGDLVESAPVILFVSTHKKTTTTYNQIINNIPTKIEKEVHVQQLPTEIENIIFNWSYLTGNKMGQKCIVLGYGSLYNSANPSNMIYCAEEKNLAIKFIAATDIKIGEELTINYSGVGGVNISKGNDWFERKNIEHKE